MTLKCNAFFGYFTEFAKAHNLETARICQNWAAPVHEFVQSAQFGNALGGGAEHKVICISKDNLCASCCHSLGQHGFHSGGSAHRHEGRRVYYPMCGGNLPNAAAVTGEREFHKTLVCMIYSQNCNILFIILQ